jgi:hypothetical protein
MYLLIGYPSGVIVEAVALAKGRNRLRVVVPGLPDTIELKRAGEQWITAEGQPVSLEFAMAIGDRGMSLAAPSATPAQVAGAAAD